jgi:hypothetical protein
MTEIPCSLVIKHEGLLAALDANLKGIAEDVAYIRTRVDDGLAVKVAGIERDLAESISKGKITAIEIKAENWFSRILQGSVTKIMGLVTVLVIMNNLVGTGINFFVKEKISKEPAGQQAEILKSQTELKATLVGYHSHLLGDGKELFHAGVPDSPAWIRDTKTNVWTPAPQWRTEVGIKQ